MKYYGQHDPLWSGKKLGASNLLVSRFGCTTCVICSAASYFGEEVTPLQMASNANNYTNEGLIVWQKLNFKKMKFVERLRERPTDSQIKECLKNPHTVILLEVNHSHWLLGLRPTLWGKDFLAWDPWDGKKCEVQKKYHRITGAAVFARK